MKRAVITRTVLSLAVAGAFGGMASQAHASAFALTEQSASGLGTSFAGAAASAEDASTIYFNPAGMSLLPSGPQISAGAAFINVSTKFSDSGSQPSGAGVFPLSGGNGGDAGSLATVPNLYFATDMGKDWKVGLGISAPFGLKTEYDSDWIGRFQAIKSSIDTLNVNPSVSYKVSDSASIGFGVNYQRIDAELTNAINFGASVFGAVLQATGNPATAQGALTAYLTGGGNGEGTVDVKGNDDAWGYNLGGIFKLSPDTRLGVTYRSSIKYHVEGTVNFSNVSTAQLTAVSPALAAAFTNGNVSLDIKMPDSASLALDHRLDSKWILLADATWTGWSKIQQLQVVRDTGTVLSTTPENFKDTWRFGVGAIYRYTDSWSLKGGLAYDQTPVNDTDRTARLPDQNRTWLSVGGQYRMSKDGRLDIGYAHLFVNDASINQNGGNAFLNGQLTGTYKNAIDILGVQFAYQF